MQKSNVFAIAKQFGIAAVLATGVSAASAGGVFTVNPGHFGISNFNGAQAPFQADKLGSTGVTRAVLSGAFGSGAGTVTGAGYSQYNSFSLNANPLGALTTGLGLNYALWAEFSFTMTLISGGLGNTNSSYKLNSVTFNVYGESLGAPGTNSVFNAGNLGANPTVGRSGDTQHLGGGILLDGVADINALGGTSFNPVMLFGLNPINGPSFFTQPNPFFPLAFASFTNTSIGVSRDIPGQALYIVTDGGTDFTNPIPEPMSLALVGVALLGAGVAGRRALRK
jgi:hypothetical protein